MCAAGACSSGALDICDDSKPCTIDSCGQAAGCVHTNVAAGTGCGTGKTCNSKGECIGQCVSVVTSTVSVSESALAAIVGTQVSFTMVGAGGGGS